MPASRSRSRSAGSDARSRGCARARTAGSRCRAEAGRRGSRPRTTEPNNPRRARASRREPPDRGATSPPQRCPPARGRRAAGAARAAAPPPRLPPAACAPSEPPSTIASSAAGSSPVVAAVSGSDVCASPGRVSPSPSPPSTDSAAGVRGLLFLDQELGHRTDQVVDAYREVLEVALRARPGFAVLEHVHDQRLGLPEPPIESSPRPRKPIRKDAVHGRAPGTPASFEAVHQRVQDVRAQVARRSAG